MILLSRGSDGCRTDSYVDPPGLRLLLWLVVASVVVVVVDLVHLPSILIGGSNEMI